MQDRLDYAVPVQVKKFLQYFLYKEGNVYEVNKLYEKSFPKLTDQSGLEDTAPYVNDDPIFLTL